MGPKPLLDDLASPLLRGTIASPAADPAGSRPCRQQMLFPTIEFAIFFPIVLAAVMGADVAGRRCGNRSSSSPATSSTAPPTRSSASSSPGSRSGTIWPRRRSAPRTTSAAGSGSAAVAVVGDLLVLGVFKYYAFFVEDVGDVLDTFGLGMPLPLLTILLPIGVSFYTFQAITYVVDVKRRDAAARLADRRRDLPQLLPSPGRRADRPRERVPAPAQAPAGPEPGRGRRRHRADRARPDQEGRTRRHPRARAGRPCIRGATGLRHARPAARRLRLARPGLLRLLRLHGHRDRARAADGLRLPAELQQSAALPVVPRVLAPLAHDAVALRPRLRLHPARRQPQGHASAPTST